MPFDYEICEIISYEVWAHSFVLFLEHDKNPTKKFAATYCMYKTDLTRGKDKHNMSINMTPETGITTEQNNTEQMYMNNRLHLS